MVTTAEVTYESTYRLVETKDFRIQINEAGEGHPVLLIHGGGPGATGWSNFAPNVPALSRKFRCIAVTMPGWGESSRQSMDSGRDGVAALLQLLDTLEIDKAAFVGNSMGGATSVRLTAEHPDRISHLVTMGLGDPAGPHLLTPAGLPEGMRALVEAYREPTKQTIRRLVQVMCFDPGFASDELVDERLKIALKYPEHREDWLAALGTGTQKAFPGFDMATLSKSDVPAMFIHGRDDRTGHYEGSLRMVAVMPNARMVLINRCGHWAQLEHADEFNRLVADFVSKG
jgi:2-hydroxy-6-oxonona-2,4-dienedioate hydrolase